jgi:hypothetical protein
MSSQQARPALFPVSRRVSQVRAAAETLYNTHGEAAATYWKAAIRSIADPLFAIGLARRTRPCRNPFVPGVSSTGNAEVRLIIVEPA